MQSLICDSSFEFKIVDGVAQQGRWKEVHNRVMRGEQPWKDQKRLSRHRAQRELLAHFLFITISPTLDSNSKSWQMYIHIHTHTQCIHTCTYAHIHNTYIHTHIHANKRGFQLSRVQAPLRQGLASRLFTDGWQVIKCSIKRMEETLIRWIGGSTNTPVTSARLCL